jgi:hypothetical protein
MMISAHLPTQPGGTQADTRACSRPAVIAPAALSGGSALANTFGAPLHMMLRVGRSLRQNGR